MSDREQWISLAEPLAEPFDDGTITPIYGRDWLLDDGSYALMWETPRVNAAELDIFEDAMDEASHLVEAEFYGWND